LSASNGDPQPCGASFLVEQASAKPEGDKYTFTNFAHKLMSSEGINPLLSDARRRADRLALEVGCASIHLEFVACLKMVTISVSLPQLLSFVDVLHRCRIQSVRRLI
jgi:hypothetical protein